jgi:hypothetical protein
VEGAEVTGGATVGTDVSEVTTDGKGTTVVEPTTEDMAMLVFEGTGAEGTGMALLDGTGMPLLDGAGVSPLVW